MKNFLQVNRALRAKKNFNFNFKSLLVLMIVLITASLQAWGDETYYMQSTTTAGTLTGHFFTKASCNHSVDVSYGGVNYTKAVELETSSTNYTNYPNGMIRYDCKTTSTDFTIVAYASKTGQSMYVGDIKESAIGSENTVTAMTTVPLNNAEITTKTYSINSTRPASLYVSVNGRQYAYIVQIIAVEKGTPLPTPGNIGYQVNFNKSRVMCRGNSDAWLDKNTFEFHPSENQTPGSPTYCRLSTLGTHYIKFTTGQYPTKLTVNVSSSKTYFIGTSTTATTNSSTASQTVNLAKNTPYYINPNGSNVQVTSLKFEAIPYSVDHTLTNVTKLSGSTGSSAAQSGSNYNAVFAAADGYELPDDITVTIGGNAATAGTDYTWDSSTGAFQVPAAKVDGAIVVTITGEAPAGCSDWGLHYGTAGEDDWTEECFTQVGSTHEWQITNFIIPEKTWWYVDNAAGNDAKKNGGSWSNLYFALSQGDGARPMVGQATGAVGTVRIYDDSGWNNRYAGFIPNGYKLKFGSTEYAMSVEAGNEYRSDVVTYSSSNARDAVSVGIVDASGDYVATDNSEGMQHIFLNTGGDDLWSTASASNFGIYDVTHGNWQSLMVKVPGEDYLYEGWIPSSCTTISFHRLASSTPKWKTNDSDGTNTNVWNSTGDKSLETGKNVFTISGWDNDGGKSGGSWSAYEKKGKFRMNADYKDKNWYVRFYPYNVLTYNANSGTGTMDEQSVACDAASKTVSVASNGFTAPAGYYFYGWNPNETQADAGTKDDSYDPSDNVTLSADVTLYAVWKPILVTGITVSPDSKTLDVGGTQTLTASATPSTALDKTVTWSSSNTSVATVDAGLVTAVAPGSATITATAHDGSGITGTCSITVNKITPTKYDFSVDKTVLCDEETATLTLEDSEVGVTYELRSDATHSIDDTETDGTGDAIEWTGLGTGSYVVYAIANDTYSERQMKGSKITVSTGTTTSITTGPTSVLDAVVGSATSLSVTAAGTSLTYQWKQCATEDGTYANVASGGTSATYNVTPSVAGTIYYKVVVTGTCGEVTSSAVSIVATAPVLYTVTFDANGGTIDDKDDADVTQESVGGEITLLTPDARSGYIFEGWEDKDENLIGVAGASYTPTANITLYAKWIALSSKCVTTNTAWTKIVYKTPSYEGVTYNLGGINDDASSITLTPAEGEGYVHFDISSLGIIKEIKITLSGVGETNAKKGLYYAFDKTFWNYHEDYTKTDGHYFNLSGSEVIRLHPTGDATKCTFSAYGTTVSISEFCIYYEVPCFMMKANTSAGDNGSLDHNESISVGSDNCISLIGGTAKYVNSTGSGTMEVTKDKGWYFNSNNDQIVVTLTEGSFLQSGSVITVAGNAGASGRGFKINGKTIYETTTSGNFSGETYTVTGSDTELLNARELTITRSNGNGLRLSLISISNCGSCTPISPSLSYSKTTIWMDDATLTATPTLTGNTGSGAVTYSSSNTDAVMVIASGVGVGTITAVGRGSATITASIAKNGGYCDAEATCDITVKDINCDELPIASATRKSGSSNAMENGAGAAYSAAGYSGQADGKLGSNGNYMYITLTGTYLRDGDVVVINIAKKNNGGIYLYKGTTSAGTAIGSIDASAVKEGDNEITLSGVPDNTSSVTMCRVEDNQNHKVDGIAVKRYSCPDSKEFLPTGDDGNWNATANWIGATGRGASLPTIDDRVIISKPVTVDIADAKAQGVLINRYSGATGKVTVSAGKALIIAETLQKTTDGSSLVATEPADIEINSTRGAGTGALIIGSHAGTNQATVNFESKVNCKSGDVNQYVGSPFSDEIPYVDYAIQMYKFAPTGTGSHGWWNKISYGDRMDPFMGYNLLTNDKSIDFLDLNGRTGHLNASSNMEMTITNGKMYYNPSWPENMFANGWLAPIHIDQFVDDDFVNVKKVIYIFNAGTPEQYEAVYGEGANSLGAESGDEDNEAPGTYTVIPVKSASELAELGAVTTVIPSMQAFSVLATNSSPELKLNFKRLVYDPAKTAVDGGTPIGIEPTRAPRRVASDEERPDAMRIRVRGENGWTANAYVLGREDFTDGYDDGWDGEYMEGDWSAPQLYSPTGDGSMVVNCVPEIEGTVIAFHAGSVDNNYTFSFVYNGENTWYLNDLREQKSVRIDAAQTYSFASASGDVAARFIISKTPIAMTPTGTGDIGDSQTEHAWKVIIDDHVYIIRNGKMYNATGSLVK